MKIFAKVQILQKFEIQNKIKSVLQWSFNTSSWARFVGVSAKNTGEDCSFGQIGPCNHTTLFTSLYAE